MTTTSSPKVIKNRAQLIDYLSVACELEQGLCIQYLFTAFSLKDSISEGITAEELTYVRKWKANIFLIAAQEMLHLGQAANLLSAIGGTVQLRRPNFPQSRRYYPTGLPWGLLPFTKEAMQLYAYYERPDVMTDDEKKLLGDWELDLADEADMSPEEKESKLALLLETEAKLFRYAAKDLKQKRPYQDLPSAYRAQTPRAVPHKTIGELYASIAKAFEDLKPRPSGTLFIGDAEAQIDGGMIDFPQILKVVDTESAVRAVELIVEQGEGCTKDRMNSHFGVFVGILRDYERLKAARPEFLPSRDVHPNPLSRLHVDNTYPGWRLIKDDFTRRVNDLTSDVYQAMMLMLYRFFATPEEKEARRVLGRTALHTMATVIKPLGEAMTLLPMGYDNTRGAGDRPRFAGASFEIDRAIQLLPYQTAAWTYLNERLLELSTRAGRLAQEAEGKARADGAELAVPYLKNAAVTLERIAKEFERTASALGKTCASG